MKNNADYLFENYYKKKDDLLNEYRYEGYGAYDQKAASEGRGMPNHPLHINVGSDDAWDDSEWRVKHGMNPLRIPKEFTEKDFDKAIEYFGKTYGFKPSDCTEIKQLPGQIIFTYAGDAVRILNTYHKEEQNHDMYLLDSLVSGLLWTASINAKPFRGGHIDRFKDHFDLVVNYKL